MVGNFLYYVHCFIQGLTFPVRYARSLPFLITQGVRRLRKYLHVGQTPQVLS